MKRELDRLESETFDVLVIGGGALGALAARACARRGVTGALVERADFAAAASGNSLKILHGGIRHLAGAQLSRFRRSRAAARAWVGLAPHLVDPLPVLLPHGRVGSPPDPALRAAGVAARLLGPIRADNPPADAGHVDSAAARTFGPLIGAVAPQGGVLFHDGLLRSPARAVLEAADDAWEHGFVVANHLEVVGAGVPEPRGPWRMEAVDRRGGGRIEPRARCVINATGAHLGRLERALGLDAPTENAPNSGAALGVNLVVNALGHDAAFGVPSPAGRTGLDEAGGGHRHLFFVPWRGRTLIGTAYLELPGVTDALPGDEPFRSTAVEQLVDRFLAEIGEALPGIGLSESDVRHVHAGLLPLGSGGALPGDPVWRERAPLGARRFLSVAAEKLTTAPLLAERCADWVLRQLDRADSAPPGPEPLPGGRGWSTELAEEATRVARERCGGRLDPEVVAHLVRTRGTRWERVASTGTRDDRWSERIRPDETAVLGELLLGVTEEMALTTEDLLLRRTDLAERGVADERAERAARRALDAVARAGRAATGR